MVADLKVFGATEAAKEIEEQDHGFEVFAENWQAVTLFVMLSTQWRVGFSGRFGLDYSAIETVFRLYKTTNRKRVFEDLRVMEKAALEFFHEEQEKEASK